MRHLRFLFPILLSTLCFGAIKTSDPSFKAGSRVDYLIIIGAEGVRREANRLAEFKTERGIRAAVVGVDSICAVFPGRDTPEKIRAFIRKAYAEWKITWVLIMGDFSQVPSRMAAKEGYNSDPDTTPGLSDTYYACLGGTWDENDDGIFGNDPGSTCYRPAFRLDSNGIMVLDSMTEIIDGTDYSREIYIGRLPVSNPMEAAVVVNKIIDYSTLSRQTNCATNVFLFGTNINGLTDKQIPTFYTSDAGDFLHYSIRVELQRSGGEFQKASFREVYLDTVTADSALLFSNRQFTAARLTAEFSRGPNLALFTAHGCPSHICIDTAGTRTFAIPDVQAIESATLSNILALSCQSILMSNDTGLCLGKSFIVNPNGGAVSYFGTGIGELGTNLDSISLKTIEAISTGKTHRIAQASQCAQQSSPKNINLFWQCWGDPEMELWTKTLSFADSLAPSYESAENGFVVKINPPLDSALICIYQPNTTFLRGYTKSGAVTFSHDITGLTGAKITATKHNYLPGRSTIHPAAARNNTSSRQPAEINRDVEVAIRGNEVVFSFHGREPASLELFTIAGHRVYSFHFSGSVRIPHLPSGIYFVRILYRNRVITKKIALTGFFLSASSCLLRL